MGRELVIVGGRSLWGSLREQSRMATSLQEGLCRAGSQALNSVKYHPSLQLSPFPQSLGGVLSEQGLEPHSSCRDAPVKSGW